MLGCVVDVDHGGGDVGVSHVCLDVGERELLDGEGAEGVAQAMSPGLTESLTATGGCGTSSYHAL